MRRTAGMLLAFAIAVPITACGTLPATATADGSPAASPSPSSQAAKVLAAAVTKTSGVNVKAVLAGDTSNQNVTAYYDVHSKIAGISSTSDGGQLKIVLTATDMYLSGPATFQGKTLRARLTKLHDNTPDDLFADILVPLHILGSATNVQATAPTTFAGKLDLTKISTTAIGTRKFLDYVIRAGGDKVKSLDFNATVDGSGYLAQFQATLPAIDNGKDADYRVDFSDFGKPVTVKTPTANVVEAPASFYTAT